MTSKVIDRIRAKITRAKQHIQDLQLGLDAFYKTNPYTIGIKEDTQAGKRIYYVSKADCVPDPLATIAADVIQNLRSPLDQIAYQLVLDANGGTVPERLVYYPITSAASEYKALRARNIKAVGQDVIDAIDATETYKGGKGHALWQLNELNKPDKHQLLVAMTFSSGGVDVMPTMRILGIEAGWDRRFGEMFTKMPPLFLLFARGQSRPGECGPRNLHRAHRA